MRPSSIGIDLDSTLNHLDKAWLKWIQETHDPEFTREKWLGWGVHEYARGGPALYDFLTQDGVFYDLEVQAEAQRVTERLVDVGHDVYVVTAFVPEACWDKSRWVRRHFPHIHEDHLIFCNKKHLLNLDVLIDDGLHNATGFGGRFLIYDQPWNQPGSHERVRGWKEVEQWLTREGYFGVRAPRPHI